MKIQKEDEFTKYTKMYLNPRSESQKKFAHMMLVQTLGVECDCDDHAYTVPPHEPIQPRE